MRVLLIDTIQLSETSCCYTSVTAPSGSTSRGTCGGTCTHFTEERRGTYFEIPLAVMLVPSSLMVSRASVRAPSAPAAPETDARLSVEDVAERDALRDGVGVDELERLRVCDGANSAAMPRNEPRRLFLPD